MNNDVSKKKKTSKEKRILIASLCIAAAVMAGSTFAWFSSKDEVTNRLTAAAEYGVAVGENFEPPENWIPGQTINKDAGAVNTGSVDAFVRMWLDGNMRVLKQNTSEDDIANYGQGIAYNNDNPGPGGFVIPTTAVTDSALLNSGLKLMDEDGNYYKLLDTTQTANPRTSLSTSQEGYPDNSKYNALSEVQSMQTGILAYAPDEAEYTYILNQETVLPILVSVGGDEDYRDISVPAGTLVHVGGTPGTAATYNSTTGVMTPGQTETITSNPSGTGSATYNAVYVKEQTHDDNNTFFNPVNVEYETFTPLTDGLYLFLRNEEDTDQGDPEFSGYYRSTQRVNNPLLDGADDDTYKAADDAVYYALNTNTDRDNRSDYTVKGLDADGSGSPGIATPISVKYDDADDPKNIVYVVPTTSLELYTAQYETIDAANLKFITNTADTTNRTQTIYAVYDDTTGTANEFDPEKDIVVEINLANVGSDPQEWTGIGATLSHFDLDGTDIMYDASLLTFYYNDDVEAGDSTAKLVDSVKLYEGVTNQAYLAFDFDLNVNLESVQVTVNEAGVEDVTPVHPWEYTKVGTDAANTGATATKGGSGNEIDSITWAAVSP